MVKTVKIAEISEILSLSERRIQQLEVDGILRKTKRGSYLLKESLQSWAAYIREMGDSQTDERKRLDKLKADTLELQYKQMSGELVDVDYAMKEWEKVVMAVRSKMLAIPNKIAPLVAGSTIPYAADVLKKSVYEILTEMANPDLVDVAMKMNSEKRERKKRRS